MKEDTFTRVMVCGTPKLKGVGILAINPWCPGCHCGIIQRLVCEVIEELDITGRAIGIVGIGCNAAITSATETDVIWGPHGRALPIASGVKRVLPEAIVYHTEGDGGLLAIGAGHFLNTMARGERLTTIFINNAAFGRTGGQMSPTTLPGMRTTTTPYGRDPVTSGYPVRAAEMAASMPGVAYSARVTVHTPANYQRAKRAVRIAFQKQIDGVGYSIVEIICGCPTNWHLNPVESLRFIDDTMLTYYPLGEFKNVDNIEL